ncbi:MAG: winged helix-turn-helix transcriptional regulator [Actinobacteria bacterium]|nr:winged helix-turn-helix transcriptional regulator [Actinomycetota bacterium]
MSKRSYNQCCAVARAMDVLGERWTLLIVRELLTGPKRFKDLLDGLPGIGTNLLTARLKDLEGYGVLRRATLPPPAASRVYELTELGRSLEPVVMSLARWGLEFLGASCEEDDRQPAWAMVTLGSVLKPEAMGETKESYEFRVDNEAFQVWVVDGETGVRQGPAADPDLVVHSDTQTLLAVAAGRIETTEAVASGALRIEGDRDARERCMKMLGADAGTDHSARHND